MSEPHPVPASTVHDLCQTLVQQGYLAEAILTLASEYTAIRRELEALEARLTGQTPAEK